MANNPDLSSVPRFDERFTNQEYILHYLRSKPGVGNPSGKSTLISFGFLVGAAIATSFVLGLVTKRLGGAEAHPRTFNKHWLEGQYAADGIGNLQENHRKGQNPDFDAAYKQFVVQVFLSENKEE